MKRNLTSSIINSDKTSIDLRNMIDKLEETNQILLKNEELYTIDLKAKEKELKAAQELLIQLENMASIGQLAAGIAHEIKNPLNFINNFAQLTANLANELSEELEKLSDCFNENDKQYITEIANDIKENTQKINEHGKRAESIIKGMLLQSRGKAGEMHPTDINAMLAEYINLGFHGMRAQDSGFNIKIDTEYDPAIGKVKVIPQNLSRVFLNIISNAFYSTNEKKKQLKDAFTPVLLVSTKNNTDTVEIRIHDNGNGIPQEILDKIFDPFFTTKPPEQGTGLGLSLSYDIVVKEHKGEMRVDSQEGEFAEFIITIPKNINEHHV
jgi:signal transduction histidine kinase